MIEFQNSIQDRVSATMYRVSHRYLVDIGPMSPIWGTWEHEIFLPPLWGTALKTQIIQTAINICAFHL